MKCVFLKLGIIIWQANNMGQNICFLIFNLVLCFFFAEFDPIHDQAGMFDIDIGEIINHNDKFEYQ